MSPVSKWEIYEYLEPLKDAIDDIKSKQKSHMVRLFIKEFCAKHQIKEVKIETMFREFCDSHPDVPMKDTYFRTICEKTWEIKTVNRKPMINLAKQKKKF